MPRISVVSLATAAHVISFALLGCGTTVSGGGGNGAGGGDGGAGGSTPSCDQTAPNLAMCDVDDDCCSGYCSSGEVGQLPKGTCCGDIGAPCEDSDDCCFSSACFGPPGQQAFCDAGVDVVFDGHVCGFDGDCASGHCNEENLCAAP